MEKTHTVLCILIICCGCLSSQETQKTMTQEAKDPSNLTHEIREQNQGPGSQEKMQEGGEIPPGNMTPYMRPPGNMTHGMRGLGLNMTEHYLDGDGLLSEEEMIAAREAMMDDPRFIERFDSDGDGVLNEEEKATMIEARNKKPTQ